MRPEPARQATADEHARRTRRIGESLTRIRWHRVAPSASASGCREPDRAAPAGVETEVSRALLLHWRAVFRHFRPVLSRAIPALTVIGLAGSIGCNTLAP